MLRRYLAVCRYVASACEPLLAHHDNIRRRVIIEGCWILPEFSIQQKFADQNPSRPVRSLYVVEQNLERIKKRFQSRNPDWVAKLTPQAFQNHARMEWLHGQFVEDQARELGLPVLETEPFATLERRARTVVESYSWRPDP